MRIAVISIAVLALVSIVSPVFVGSRIENSVQEYVAQLEDMPMYRVSVIDYDKGYRSSVATIAVGLDPEMLEAMTAIAPILLEAQDNFDLMIEGSKFQVDIQNGPILTKHGLGLGWADMSADINRDTYPELAQLFDFIGNDELLHWHARIDLTGSGWAKTHAPDMDLEMPTAIGSVNFVLTGMEADMTFSDYGASIYENSSIDELSFSMNAEQSVEMSLKDMNAEGQLLIGEPIWLYLADYEVDIEGVQLSVADEFKMDVADTLIDIVIEGGDTPQTITLKESFRFETADFNEHQVTNGHFSFSYINISEAFWTSYIEPTMPPKVLAKGPDAKAFMMEELKSIAVDALAYNSRFNFDRIAFEYQEGKMDASASVAINSDMLQTPFDVSNPLALVPALQAEASLEVNEELLRSIALAKARQDVAALPDEQKPTDEQIEQMVEGQLDMLSGPLVEQGYVTREDDVFSAEFSFSNGTALVNGKPIPLPF